jgi:hypothetical protein
MAIISEVKDYNGFAAKVARLGLDGLVTEARSTVADLPLYIKESRYANGTRGIRQTIDDNFDAIGGWECVKSGGIDWTKASKTGARLGVEVQVSGRSDMLAVDILHLSESLSAGRIDAGLIIVPDDTLSRFLTDRTPNLATAIRHVDHRAARLAIRVLAFRHDGVGAALPKHRTNLGRLKVAEEPPEDGYPPEGL